MASKYINKYLVEDLKRQIVAVEDDLTRVQSYLKLLDTDGPDIELNLRRRIREADQIYDFWKGPRAAQYVEQKIADCNDSLHVLHQITDRIRDDLNGEASRLRQRRERLQAELDRILFIPEHGTTKPTEE